LKLIPKGIRFSNCDFAHDCFPFHISAGSPSRIARPAQDLGAIDSPKEHEVGLETQLYLRDIHPEAGGQPFGYLQASPMLPKLRPIVTMLMSVNMSKPLWRDDRPESRRFNGKDVSNRPSGPFQRCNDIEYQASQLIP
jgi:hypothetical protein